MRRPLFTRSLFYLCHMIRSADAGLSDITNQIADSNGCDECAANSVRSRQNPCRRIAGTAGRSPCDVHCANHVYIIRRYRKKHQTNHVGNYRKDLMCHELVMFFQGILHHSRCMMPPSSKQNAAPMK